MEILLRYLFNESDVYSSFWFLRKENLNIVKNPNYMLLRLLVSVAGPQYVL